ncbi:MAG: hypothetical protein V4710_16530, partial [Verrucomicrobiota bacterium]
MNILTTLVRMFSRMKVRPEGDMIGEIQWSEPHENEFLLRVLDCRTFATSVISTTTEPNVVAYFRSAPALSGCALPGSLPEHSTPLTCALEYLGLPVPASEGPLFLAAAMEQKWNIFHFGRRLYFARSWTGRLEFVAELDPHCNHFKISKIWTDLSRSF